MSRTSDIAALIDHREELIIRLAEMAGILREARLHHAAEPLLCLYDCDAHHWTPWGPGDVCCNCGTRPLAASHWHRLLVAALRETIMQDDERAA